MLPFGATKLFFNSSAQSNSQEVEAFTPNDSVADDFKPGLAQTPTYESQNLTPWSPNYEAQISQSNRTEESSILQQLA